MAIDEADATRAPYAAPEAALMGAADVLTRGAGGETPDNPPSGGYADFYPPAEEDDDGDDDESS